MAMTLHPSHSLVQFGVVARRVVAAAHFIGLVLCLPSTAIAGDLSADLHDLAQLQEKAQVTPNEIDRAGEELLRMHSDAGDQARIHFLLAHLHAQTGLKSPEALIHHAKKASELPLDLVLRVKLYLYWGDALQVSNAGVTGDTLAEKRGEVVVPYLIGLNELANTDLPDTPPRLPQVFKFVIPAGAPGYEETVQEHEQALAAWRKAKSETELIELRDALTQQIVFLYTRRPFNNPELSELARQKIGNETEATRLISSVETGVRHRAQQLGVVLSQDSSSAAETTKRDQPPSTQPTTSRAVSKIESVNHKDEVWRFVVMPLIAVILTLSVWWAIRRRAKRRI